MIIWIIGMSGAGKTTIARGVHRIWQQAEPNTVIVDGDEIRDIMRENEQPDAHEISGRRRNALRIFRLCRWLDRQDINVVCSILSIFPELRQRNHDEFSRYFEVFVDVPFDVLLERDVKGVYAPDPAGRKQNVVGIDIPFPRPVSPDLTIDNSQPGIDVDATARSILAAAGVLG